MKYILSILSLFFLACAPYPFVYNEMKSNGHITQIAPIYIEDTWNDTDRARLHSAIDQWNQALNGELILQVENEHYHYTDNAPQNKLLLLQISEEKANKHEQYISLAWTHGRSTTGVGGNRIYFVRTRINNDDLRYVALHELGHALGSDHINYKGLMSAIYNKEDYLCIDQLVLLQIARYHHLSIEHLRACH